MKQIFRYFIRLAFDGTRYHGWQQQPNAPTVQHVLTEAISLLLNQSVLLTGCGRTDAGVHAEVFYAHMDLPLLYSPDALHQLTYRLNRFLPKDIVVFNVFPVPETWHARYSAQSRTYRYRISRKKNPFSTPYTYAWFLPLDVDLMNRGAEILLSLQDFTSFSKVKTDTKTNICEVTLARWETQGDELLFFIQANRFLRNMVRAIVGTLLELGTGKISLEDFHQITGKKNRSDAGESVPASGLSLIEVTYPESPAIC